MGKRVVREVLDSIFMYGCAILRHRNACALANWWVNTDLYRRLYYHG